MSWGEDLHPPGNFGPEATRDLVRRRSAVLDDVVQQGGGDGVVVEAGRGDELGYGDRMLDPGARLDPRCRVDPLGVLPSALDGFAAGDELGAGRHGAER